MTKMKPEDVMRAMECCIVENDKDDCLGCPYSGKRHRGEMCVTHLLEDALALLREKDAEIDKRLEALLKFYPCNGEFEDAKKFVDFHWKHIRHSIMCDYDAELKKKKYESEGAE